MKITNYDSAIGDIISGLYTMKAIAKSDNPRELEVIENILTQVMEFDERMAYMEGPNTLATHKELESLDA